MSATDPTLAKLIDAVAGAGRDLEAHRRRLDDLDGLREQVRSLAVIVNDLSTAAASATPPSARPASWLGWHTQRQNSADPDAAEALLRSLMDWLNSVFLRYADAAEALPECWLWHPDAVEELVCLWQAWGSAYAATSVTGASDWHDRLRPGVVRRLKAGLSTCSFDSHAAGGMGKQAAAGSEGITLVARWWAAGSKEPPPVPEGGRR